MGPTPDQAWREANRDLRLPLILRLYMYPLRGCEFSVEKVFSKCDSL